MAYTSPTTRWKAVQTRDKHASSAFVYAVLTTRIFCRPTCPARLARRANVEFYDDSRAALAAGFRACKRCRPNDDGDDEAGLAGVVNNNNRAPKLVDAACAYIHEMEGNVTLTGVAKHVGISPRYLHRCFGDVRGCTPAAYSRWVRRGRDWDRDWDWDWGFRTGSVESASPATLDGGTSVGCTPSAALESWSATTTTTTTTTTTYDPGFTAVDMQIPCHFLPGKESDQDFNMYYFPSTYETVEYVTNTGLFDDNDDDNNNNKGRTIFSPSFSSTFPPMISNPGSFRFRTRSGDGFV